MSTAPKPTTKPTTSKRDERKSSTAVVTRNGLAGAMLVGLLLATGLLACENSRVYERNLSVSNQQWTYETVQRFEVEVADTTVPHNIFVNIRHSDRFDWANLWMSFSTSYPNGQGYERRLDMPLARPDGRWLGVCSGEICFRQQLVQAGVIFPRSGTYVFELRQDMRIDTLPGILDVGMRIEQVRDGAVRKPAGQRNGEGQTLRAAWSELSFSDFFRIFQHG